MIASSFPGAKCQFSRKLGFREGKKLILSNVPGYSHTKRAVIAKLLDLDICCKKDFWSAFQDATFVKISSKSENFYDPQFLEPEILEF